MVSSSSSKASEAPLVLTQLDDGILTITLNRPEMKNAFNSDLYTALTKALVQARDDEHVLVVILTGSGTFFSSGADLTSTSGIDEMSERSTRDLPVGLFMWEIMHFPKPIIACVNGPAVGVGFTLLLHCEVVLCSQDAYFWSPFARIALTPELVSSMLFREIFGPSITSELILAGKKLSAQEAYHLRFVSRVLPDTASLLRDGREVARQMIAFPLPEKTLPLFKGMLKYPSRMDEMQSVHEMEMRLLTQRIRNGDAAEGIALFLQRQREEKDKEKAKAAGGGKSKL